MGLIYSSSDSSAMMRALSSNLAVARTTTSELTAGCQQLIAAIDGHTLSGAAYNAGKGLFSELVIPTIHRMTAAVDNVQSDLAKYSAADAFIASEGFLDEDKLKLKIKIMKANQQLLHDSARAVATLAHSQPIPGIYELLQNAQRTFIKMAESMQQDIDKLHKQIQKLNEFDRQTKNLFATSLEEMQLAMQGILVLNETTVKSNGLYTLPSGVDKSYFTEIKKEASTILETAKPKIELIKKTDSLEEISRKTIACANIGINPYTGKKISQKEANKFKYAAWAGTLTEVGNVVLGARAGKKAASRLDGLDDVGSIKKGSSYTKNILKGNKVGKNYTLDKNKNVGNVTYKKASGFEFGNVKKLEIHFSKHGSEMRQALNKKDYSVADYLRDANHVIKKGQFVPEMNGYIKLVGGEGSAKYAFVGIDRATGNITTLHLKSVKELAKKAPSLGVKP